MKQIALTCVSTLLVLTYILTTTPAAGPVITAIATEKDTDT